MANQNHYVIENLCDCDYEISGCYYVYALVDPRNDKPFYIGKGKNHRMIQHITCHTHKDALKSNPIKNRKIAKIIRLGLKVRILILSKYRVEMEAYDKEKIVIGKLGRISRKDGILTNLSAGGTSGVGKISDSFTKPVYQFNKFNELVAEHENIYAAAQYVNINPHGIFINCHNIQPSSGGYVWSYDKIPPPVSTTKSPIYQWDLTGNLINRFTNIKKASESINSEDTSIIFRAIRKKTVSRGFIWSKDPVFPDIEIKNNGYIIRDEETGIVYPSIKKAHQQTKKSYASIKLSCDRSEPVGECNFKYIKKENPFYGNKC